MGFFCTQCKRSFPVQRGYQTHIRVHHRHPKPRTGPSTFRRHPHLTGTPPILFLYDIYCHSAQRADCVIVLTQHIRLTGTANRYLRALPPTLTNRTLRTGAPSQTDRPSSLPSSCLRRCVHRLATSSNSFASYKQRTTLGPVMMRSLVVSRRCMRQSTLSMSKQLGGGHSA